MCALTFDYEWANSDVGNDMWPFQLAEISEEEKKDFEKLINFKYKDYCSRINAVDGKILVGYSKGGDKIIRHQLICPEDLYLEIHERLD